MYVCTYVCMCVCMYVYMYVCMYVIYLDCQGHMSLNLKYIFVSTASLFLYV